MIKTIKTDENDRLEFNYCLNSLNIIHNYVVQPLPMSMTEEKAGEYYTGVMSQFRDAKVLEHMLRCKFAEKYKVGYAFDWNNGTITYDEEVATAPVENETH